MTIGIFCCSWFTHLRDLTSRFYTVTVFISLIRSQGVRGKCMVTIETNMSHWQKLEHTSLDTVKTTILDKV